MGIAVSPVARGNKGDGKPAGKLSAGSEVTAGEGTICIGPGLESNAAHR